jgi:hypothetical protein
MQQQVVSDEPALEVGQQYVDGAGREWLIKAERSPRPHRSYAIQVRFPDPEDGYATFVMSPGEFMQLCRRTQMRVCQ